MTRTQETTLHRRFSWHQSLRLMLELDLETEVIYCPPRLTEQPSFTITCHPNKLQGRDTSRLNQLVDASE